MSPNNKPFVVTLCDGKYTVINDAGVVTAELYGQPWRDFVGDGLVLAMMHEIERLKGELADVEKINIPASHPTVKKWRYDALNVAVGIAERHRQIYHMMGTEESGQFARLCGYIAADINTLLPIDQRRHDVA